MKKWLAPILSCLVLGLAVAGCGDDDDGDSGGSAATTEQTTTTEQAGGSGGDKAAKTVTAEIVDIDYEPRELTVAKGTTVEWTNTGSLPHTVTKDDGPGPDFDSGTVDPNGTFEQTFTTAGKIDYVCTIHPNQRGSVTVE